MPKKVLDRFIRDMSRDIRSHFHVGDKYYTLEKITEKFKVSRQTAHRGVHCLAEQNILSTRPKSGIIVTGMAPHARLTGKKITLLLNDIHITPIQQALLRGAKHVAGPVGITVSLAQSPKQNYQHLAFGEYLLGLDTDGILAIGFDNAALGFYHALREGVDLVSDIALDELPCLPVVQTDNYTHGREAGKTVREKGYSEILVAGNVAADNAGYCRGFLTERYRGFTEALAGADIRIRYISITDPAAYARMEDFMERYTADKAVFSLEVNINPVIAAQFVQHAIPPEDINFLAYNTYGDYLEHQNLPPVPSIGPSIERIGRHMTEKMIAKWQANKWPEPMVQLI